jgi:hypothetical protein
MGHYIHALCRESANAKVQVISKVINTLQLTYVTSHAKSCLVHYN